MYSRAICGLCYLAFLVYGLRLRGARRRYGPVWGDAIDRNGYKNKKTGIFNHSHHMTALSLRPFFTFIPSHLIFIRYKTYRCAQ